MLNQKVKPLTFEDYFNNPNGPQLFIETFLFIATKNDGIERFILNNIQLDYLEYLVKKYWKKFVTKTGKVRYRFQGIREICLKARQFGLSTLICALIFYDTICNEGTNSAIYCQDDEASKKMLKKYKLYYDNILEQFKPEASHNSVTTMVFGKMYSSITSQTPGSSAKVAGKKGRSETLRNVHCSEFAEWTDSETTMTGLMKAVPSTGNVFIESSPKKVGDYFHVLYNFGKKKNSKWISQFFPWFKFAQNRIDELEEQKEWLLDPINQDEQKVIHLYKLDNGQLAWRRKQIDSAFGDIKKFLKEEPEDDIACFESNSELVFPAEVRKVNCKKNQLPILGHIYCIGVDVGGGGSHSDDSSIVVIDSNTREQVYQKNLIIKPQELIPLVFQVWQTYPGFVGIESNNDVGLSAIRAAYMIPEWEQFLFKNNNKRKGFWTGANKRPIIDSMIIELQQVAQGYPGLKISSERIVQEMNWFQVLDDGSYGSPPRTSENVDRPNDRLTDDSIMGLMIAYEAMKYTHLIKDIFFKMFVLPELIKNPRLFEKDTAMNEFYKSVA